MQKKIHIGKIYETLTKRCRYDLDVAIAVNNELFADNLTASDFLKRNQRIVSSCHLGCCLNFSLCLMSMLKENGIHTRMVTTPEHGGKKVSVAYKEKEGDEWYIADIVEDIKFFTNLESEYAKENHTSPKYMHDLRQKHPEALRNHLSISLDEFKSQNEYVEMYADIFEFSGTMSDFLHTAHKI